MPEFRRRSGLASHVTRSRLWRFYQRAGNALLRSAAHSPHRPAVQLRQPDRLKIECWGEHMPSVHENLQTWEDYNWVRSGEEWSSRWGSSDAQWFSTILP